MEDKLKEGPWWDSPDKQARVVADAIKIRDQDIRGLKLLRSMLVGPDYAGGQADDDIRKPTNSTYGFYARMLPACLGGQIRFMVDTDYGSPEEPLALNYEVAVNECYRRSGGDLAVELAFADMVCGYGGLFVKQGRKGAVKLSESDRGSLKHPVGRQPWESRAGFTDAAAEPKPQVDAEPTMPEIHYLPPDTWGWDRRAFTFDHAEFLWYDSLHDVHELIQRAKDFPEEGWDLKKLQGARDSMLSQDLTKIGGKETRSQAEAERDREKIRVRSLFVKNATIEGEERPEHHHSVRYTLWAPYASPEAAVWIRPPQYEFGPPFGQFVLFYQHMVGEDSTPLNVLQANLTKLTATDAMHAVAYKKIREQRRVYGVDAALAGQLQELENAADGAVVPLQGMSELGGVQEFVRGGLDAAVVAGLQYLDAQLAKDLGLDDSARGATNPNDSTATEAALANAQSNARAAQFKLAFNRGLERLARILGWYAMHDPRLVAPLNFEARAKVEEARFRDMDLGPDMAPMSEEEAKQAGRRAAAAPDAHRYAMQGGDFAKVPHLDFNAVRFRVAAELQVHKAPETRRIESAQLRQDLAMILTLIPQMPYFDWIGELRQLEEDYGRRGLVDRLSPQFASLMAQARLEMGETQMQVPQGAGPGMQHEPGGPRVTTQGAPVRGQMAKLGASSGSQGMPEGGR